MSVAYTDFTADPLLTQIQIQIEQICFPPALAGPDLSFKLYEEHLSIRDAEAQVTDTCFCIRIPATTNTNKQRRDGIIHESARVEIEFGKKLTARATQRDMRYERARTRLVTQRMLNPANFKGYEVMLKSSTHIEDGENTILITTMYFEITYFWNYQLNRPAPIQP